MSSRAVRPKAGMNRFVLAAVGLVAAFGAAAIWYLRASWGRVDFQVGVWCVTLFILPALWASLAMWLAPRGRFRRRVDPWQRGVERANRVVVLGMALSFGVGVIGYAVGSSIDRTLPLVVAFLCCAVPAGLFCLVYLAACAVRFATVDSEPDDEADELDTLRHIIFRTDSAPESKSDGEAE